MLTTPLLVKKKWVNCPSSKGKKQKIKNSMTPTGWKLKLILGTATNVQSNIKGKILKWKLCSWRRKLFHVAKDIRIELKALKREHIMNKVWYCRSWWCCMNDAGVCVTPTDWHSKFRFSSLLSLYAHTHTYIHSFHSGLIHFQFTAYYLCLSIALGHAAYETHKHDWLVFCCCLNFFLFL